MAGGSSAVADTKKECWNMCMDDEARRLFTQRKEPESLEEADLGMPALADAMAEGLLERGHHDESCSSSAMVPRACDCGYDAAAQYRRLFG